MSSLVTIAGLTSLTDLTGVLSATLLSAVDPGNSQAQDISAQLLSVFATDIDQALAWYPDARAMYAGAAASSGTGLFGASSAGSFGTAQGLVSRGGLMPAALFGWLERIRRQIQAYGSAVNASIVDIPTFAAYYNAASSHSCLFSPDFASAYWLAYGGGRQLDPSSVFAPADVAIAAVTVSALNTATFSDTYPRVNGYASPSPTTDAYGNAVYSGGLPMAQGFAAPLSVEAIVTTAVNGTCALALTAPNESGTSTTWTATLDGLGVGAVAGLTPSTSGSRIGGAVTAVTVAGTASAGVAAVRVAAAERTIS